MTIVLLASFFLGFVLQIVTYDEVQRARQSQVGTLGGLLIGSLASAQQHANLTVAFVGFLGGGLGAAIGWTVALVISYKAATNEQWKTVLQFLNGGTVRVNEYMKEQDDTRKSFVVNEWSLRYGEMVRKSREELSSASIDDQAIESALLMWLKGLADAFNYLTIDARQPTNNQYQLRASLIRFDPEIVPVSGRHWISYAGRARKHSDTAFGEESDAYLVLTGVVASPCRKDADSSAGEQRGGTYRAYSVARVNEQVVLTIDWVLNTIRDEYLNTLGQIVNGRLVVDIAELLKRHSSF